MELAGLARPADDQAERQPGGLDAPPRSPRGDGAVALIGIAIFSIIVLALHVLQPEFEPCCRFVSELALGDWGLLMNVAFLALGVGIAALAHGFRRALRPGKRVTASVRLLYVMGASAALSAFFNSDTVADSEAGRTSWHGALHDLVGFAGVLAAILATFLLRGVFARDENWRRLAPTTLMFGIAIVVSFVLVLAAPLDSFGVTQRVYLTVIVLWLGTLATALIGASPTMGYRSDGVGAKRDLAADAGRS